MEKHSDWHYTMGAFTKEEVKRLRAGFRSDLDNHVEAIQAEALTALVFSHDYFFDDPYKELEITMMPSLEHLEIQFGNRNWQMSIPYEGPFIPTRNMKRLSHAIDFEPTWRLAFEETRKRLEAAK